MNNPEEAKTQSESLSSSFSCGTIARAGYLPAMRLNSSHANAKASQKRREALERIMVIEEDVK
jgi:hypothetical protein